MHVINLEKSNKQKVCYCKFYIIPQVNSVNVLIVIFWFHRRIHLKDIGGSDVQGVIINIVRKFYKQLGQRARPCDDNCKASSRICNRRGNQKDIDYLVTQTKSSLKQGIVKAKFV